MMEVPSHERDIYVPRFSNRLAVVHAFEHRQQPGVLLNAARDGVEMASARVRRERLPALERAARGAYRKIDVVARSVRGARDRLARGRIDDVERLSRLGPGSVDVVPERAVALLEPGERPFVALRRRAVLHRLKDFSDCRHGLWHWHAVRRGVPAGHEMLELALDVGE